jgi:S1-C subfamily serine protease
MKAVAFLSWLGVSALVCLGAEKPSTVTWEGKEVRGISDVHISADGRIIVVDSNGNGFSTTEDKLPQAFLLSWGITQEKLQNAQSARVKKSEDDFERAVRSGLFREVGGIVYDLRKTQPDWTYFANARVLQVIDDGVILNVSTDPDTVTGILVHNMPKTLADMDRVSITAKLTGSFSFMNKLGFDRTIRAYDVGRPCARDEIPDAVRKENKLWAKVMFGAKGTQETLAQLPDSAKLRASGTGFFITEDGYLLTNHHVVEDAKRVKIRTRAGVLPAEIVKTDLEKDLALLKVEGGPYKPLPIAGESAVALGESAFTIGFPNVEVQGLEPKYTDGKISSLSGLHDDPSEYQISVPVQPGNSGGPLMARTGQAIGVVVAQLNEMRVLAVSGSLPQNVNYAVKASVVRDFLKDFPQLKLANPKPSATSEDTVKATEQGVAMVLVY